MATDSDSNVLHSLPNKTTTDSNKAVRQSLHPVWWLLGFMLLVFVVLSAIALRQQPQTQQMTFDPQTASVLSSLSPEVSVKKPDSQSFQIIDGSEPITAGTEITTGDGGRAVLFSGNGILTTIEENSRVRLQQNNNADNQTRFELLAGGLWARISSVLTDDESYQVEAGDTITSVRGTEFGINATADSVTVSTIRDEVNVKTELPNTATSSFVSKRILSGQQASVSTGQPLKSMLSVNNMSEEKLQDQVSTGGDTLDIINGSDLQKQAIVMEGLPVLAESKSLQSDGLSDNNFGRFEKMGEYLYESFFTHNRKEGLQFNLLQIQERLNEIDTNKVDQAKLGELLGGLQSEVVKVNDVAEDTNDVELQQDIVKALRLYARNVHSMAKSSPQPTKELLRQTENITLASHRSAINALASTSPRLSLEESLRTMNDQLAQVQVAMVNGNGKSARAGLREYNSFAQKSRQISGRSSSEDLVRLGGQLRKNLSAFAVMDRLSNNTSPGISRTVNQVRNNIISSQTSIIKELATSSPDNAIDIYEKTTDYYIGQISTSKNAKEIESSIEAMGKFSKFGRELVSSPGPDSAGTSTSSFSKKMRQVAKQQENRLRNVTSKLTQEARRSLEQTIKNLRRIQQQRSVTTLGSKSSGVSESDNVRQRNGIDDLNNTSGQQGGQDGARPSDDSGQVDRSSEAASEKSQDTDQSYRNPDKNIIPVQELKTSDPFNLFTFDIEANEMPVNIEGVTARFTINDKEGQQLSYEDVVNNAVLLLGEKRFDVDRFNLRSSSGNYKVYDLMFDVGDGVRFNSSKSKTARLVFLLNQTTGNYKQGTEIRTSLEAGSIQTSSGLENQTDVPGAWYILNSE